MFEKSSNCEVYNSQTMKALTLHQPWATLIADGWKEIETRDWYTGYRGPLAIHAAKLWNDDLKDFLDSIACNTIGVDWREAHYTDSLGCIAAVCRLAYCVPTEYVESVCMKFKEGIFLPKHGWATEKRMGNYEKGRWAWILRDVRLVLPAIAVRGNRKLWDWTPPGGAFTAEVLHLQQ
jgi:hypothetical protein